tara:strand:+ start:82 stop:924 length:843 start_codon:yes stop_codon:yes gene_type:complete
MSSILKKLSISSEKIYYDDFNNSSQVNELKFRKKISSEKKIDYFKEISKNHSIRVMDNEIVRILKKVPKNGLILDLGGCWGWHWRNIILTRPDVKVFLLDFVMESLIHSKEILKNQVNNNIYLINSDINKLPFENKTFDLVWTVQALQHIPSFENACKEAFRVLKNNGTFINYSFNSAFFIKWIYFLLRKKYHISGNFKGEYFLERGSKKQENIIKKVFLNKIYKRYTENLFHPDLKINTGSEKSIIGKLDSYLSSNFWLLKFISRQISYEVKKIENTDI